MSSHIMTQLVPPDPEKAAKKTAFKGVRDADLPAAARKLANERFGTARVTLPEPKMMQIMAGKLFVDRSYERKMDMPWVRRIVAEFDPDKFHPILVSAREDGTFAIIDGQHRIAALDVMGWLDQNVPCLVYEGLSIAQEAELFYTQKDRKSLTSHDEHRAGVVAGREVPVDIQRILEQYGYRVDAGSKMPDNIPAIVAVYSVYNKSSPEMLGRILDILGSVWRPRNWQINHSILHALRYFIARYDVHPEFSEERLRIVLASTNPKDFHDLTKKQMDATKSTVGASGARVLIYLYNSRLRSNHRLPNWDVEIIQ